MGLPHVTHVYQAARTRHLQQLEREKSITNRLKWIHLSTQSRKLTLPLEKGKNPHKRAWDRLLVAGMSNTSAHFCQPQPPQHHGDEGEKAILKQLENYHRLFFGLELTLLIASSSRLQAIINY